jgi:ribonuclease HII
MSGKSSKKSNASETFYRVGIDENGLGPQLGPLIVTGVLAELSPSGKQVLEQVRWEDWPWIDDSKKVSSHHDISWGEAWARVLFPQATNPEQLLRCLAWGGTAWLEELCPTEAKAQCWGYVEPDFHAQPKMVAEIRNEYGRLCQSGVQLKGVQSMVICARRLHGLQAAGHTLFSTDLHAMERLLLSFSKECHSEWEAVCGKVGGIRSYVPKFLYLKDYEIVTEIESQACSTYRVAGLGRVSFVRDADGNDLLVALSSMVGKYVRELLQAKINQFYVQQDASLETVSGYRDPRTKRFVEQTQLLRKSLAIPDDCFLRPESKQGRKKPA